MVLQERGYDYLPIDGTKFGYVDSEHQLIEALEGFGIDYEELIKFLCANSSILQYLYEDYFHKTFDEGDNWELIADGMHCTCNDFAAELEALGDYLMSGKRKRTKYDCGQYLKEITATFLNNL